MCVPYFDYSLRYYEDYQSAESHIANRNGYHIGIWDSVANDTRNFRSFIGVPAY